MDKLADETRAFIMFTYLTVAELAARLKVKPKTIRNKMTTGLFTEGIHYSRRPGLGARFKWSAVVQWMESGDTRRLNSHGSWLCAGRRSSHG